MPYPYEEKRRLVLAALRVLTAENGQASAGIGEIDCATDLLEEAAEVFAEAMKEYRENHGI